YGGDIGKEIDGPRAAELKCLGTSAFMLNLRESLQKQDRRLKLSTTGGADWRYERTLGRNWSALAKVGCIRLSSGQVYVTDPAEFSRQAGGVIHDLHGDCPVVIGIGAKWSGGANTTASMVRQVELARQAGAQGVAFYHGAALSGECLDALKHGPFRE